MIAIINTGGANLSSVSNALDRLNQDWQITIDPAVIRNAKHVILPGVGAAKDSMARIREANLVDVIVKLKQPVLGICLGMQLLYEHSEEGDTPCLGVIPGQVRHIPRQAGLSLPHMGWNRLKWQRPSSAISSDIEDGSWFYFVHSYCGDLNEWTVATCSYGSDIPALVQKDNFWGAQFHPERSAKSGAQLLRNFIKL